MSTTKAAAERALAIAVLDALHSVSERNLRTGRTGTVGIPRAYVNALRDAFEDAYPGAQAKLREMDKIAARHYSDPDVTRPCPDPAECVREFHDREGSGMVPGDTCECCGQLFAGE